MDSREGDLKACTGLADNTLHTACVEHRQKGLATIPGGAPAWKF